MSTGKRPGDRVPLDSPDRRRAHCGPMSARVRQTAGRGRAARDPIDVDVAIVGGGLAGQVTAAALGGAGLSCAVVDRADPERLASLEYDGRTTAFALGSQRVLAGIGVWPRITEAAAIRDIRVSDSSPGGGPSRLFLHYCGEAAGGADAPAPEAMGWIVENAHIRRVLFEHLRALPTVRLVAPATVQAVERGGAEAVLHLGDGRRLRAPLVVGADGRSSALRRDAGIRTVSWTYDQISIVCVMRHQRPHHGVALENFLPSGPFAVLPMADAADGSHRSSIVWTERADLAPRMLALDDDAFSAELQRRTGRWLGAVRVAGRRWSHPLGLLHATRYVDRRLVLVGDAAHAIHPIAGQGLNLGIRDIAALSEILVDAYRLGLDVGNPDLLHRYQRWRRFDNLSLALVTDGLNRLFSNDIAPVRGARRLGLGLVDRIDPAKRFFMRHAMGLVGKLPRLVRGEVL